jgi:hypothetical protein
MCVCIYGLQSREDGKIMIIKMFATLDKAKPDTENVRGLK